MYQDDTPQAAEREEEREQVFGQLPEPPAEQGGPIPREGRRDPKVNAFLGGTRSQLAVALLFLLIVILVIVVLL